MAAEKPNQFTAEEKAAARERVRELKAASRGGKNDGEQDVLAKIAEMPEPIASWPSAFTRSSRRRRRS